MTDSFPFPYTKEHAQRFINFAMQTKDSKLFAIEINGKAAGGIGLHAQTDIFRYNMELGYWLAEPFWGNGIITEAIQQTVEFGFQNYPIHRIFARPFGSNAASQRVLEKAGFKLEARLKNTILKNGRPEDELIYGIRRND